MTEDESIPDGTFGGTFQPSKARTTWKPVTEKQADRNRQDLENALRKGKRHGKEDQ